MEVRRKSSWLFLLLGLICLAVTLQGVQGGVESEGPSESECRPYIEKALKELETADSKSPGDLEGDSNEDVPTVEITTDDSDHEEDDGENDDEVEGTDSTETVEQEEAGESEEKEAEDNEQSTEQAEEAEKVEGSEEEIDKTEEEREEEEEEVKEEEEEVEAKEEEEEEEVKEEEEAKEDEEEEEVKEEDEEEEEEEEVKEEDEEEEEEVKEEEEAESEKSEETEDVEGEKSEETEDVEGEKSEEATAESTEETEGEEAAEEEEKSEEVEEEQQVESKTESQEEEVSAEKVESEEATPAQAESTEDEQESEETEKASPEEEDEETEKVKRSIDDDEAAESPEEKDDQEDEKSAEVEGEQSVEDTRDDEESKEGVDSDKGDESVEDEAAEGSKEDTKTDDGDSKEAGASSKEDDAVDKEGDDGEVLKEESAEEQKDEEKAPSKEEKEEEDGGSVEEKEEGGESEEASEETAPEEELIDKDDVPTELRETEHISQLLKLDEENLGAEKIISNVAEITLRELKKIYENAIKPLEVLYKYRDLSNRHFGDAEIFSKPLVVFMGPWSGGKSSIINYLIDNEYNDTSLRTGAEPSPAYFNILMYGEEPEVLDGTQLAADFTFSGLQKFGQGLEERLRGLKLPKKLLEKMNLIEIPGILEVRKQVSRVFPFNDACQWFIDRADIIFLVYDPSKLDVGPETEAILDQLKGREHQTRIILNKADQVKPEELMRVQGALIWNISPLMSSAQPPVMYTTSLWSRPYEPWAPVRLLQAQERAFLRDLRTAIDKRIENKIASARRFAVRVRNHAKMVDCYLTTYYNHKSVFGNRKQVSDAIIEHPQDYHIYEGLSTLTNISRYDLPDPDVYRDFFRLNPLYDFQQLSATCTYFRGCPINRLDVAIAYDLPELVGKHKRMLETALAEVSQSQTPGS